MLGIDVYRQSSHSADQLAVTMARVSCLKACIKYDSSHLLWDSLQWSFFARSHSALTSTTSKAETANVCKTLFSNRPVSTSFCTCFSFARAILVDHSHEKDFACATWYLSKQPKESQPRFF